MAEAASAGPYPRVVLKVSGDGFVEPGQRGITPDAVLHLARQIHTAAQSGTQIAIVLGGGNLIRGAQFTAGQSYIHEYTAHYMGMLATVMNGLALQDALESLGCETRLMTALHMDGVAEPYIHRRARRHLEKGRLILLAGGTGSPYVTTDTAAAQRALELEASVLLKATRVDGVYSDDPEKIPMLFCIAKSPMKKCDGKTCGSWTPKPSPNACNMISPLSCSTSEKRAISSGRSEGNALALASAENQKIPPHKRELAAAALKRKTGFFDRT